MSHKVIITVNVNPNDSAPVVLQVARALAGYAALLVEEAIGGVVSSGLDKLEFGTIKMRVAVVKKDYESES